MPSILWLPVVFLTATFYLFILASTLPKLYDGEVSKDSDSAIKFNNTNTNSGVLYFPSNVRELNELSGLLSVYAKKHVFHVLLLFCSAYIYKQTFAIPGSVFLNILAGALYGLPIGLPLACLLSAFGATCCYLLSYFFAKSYVLHYFPQKIEPLRRKIHHNVDKIIFVLISLRLFPMSPNWFLNLASPVLDVPVHYFFLSVLIGLIPYNFICVQGGCILSQIKSTRDIFTPSLTVKLFLLALVPLLPGYWMKEMKKRNKNT